jgi:hypothetical protein
VLVEPSIEDVVHRWRRLVAVSVAFCLWPRLMAGASAAASVVCVTLSRAIMVVVIFIIGVACCY